MPLYCFTDKSGETLSEFFPLGKAPRAIVRSKRRYRRDLMAEKRGFYDTPSCWPKVSDALGVDATPESIRSAEAELRSKGVPTHFNKHGQAIIESKSHFRRLCEATGHYDKDGGYGAPRRQRDKVAA